MLDDDDNADVWWERAEQSFSGIFFHCAKESCHVITVSIHRCIIIFLLVFNEWKKYKNVDRKKWTRQDGFACIFFSFDVCRCQIDYFIVVHLWIDLNLAWFWTICCVSTKLFGEKNWWTKKIVIQFISKSYTNYDTHSAISKQSNSYSHAHCIVLRVRKILVAKTK